MAAEAISMKAGDINYDLTHHVYAINRSTSDTSRPQLFIIYLSNTLSILGSVAIIIIGRWVMRAVPSQRSRLWLVMAVALSNLGFSLANWITDIANTTGTLACAVSVWCYIFFQLLTTTLVIISTFRLCGTFLFTHHHRVPSWTIALCPVIAFTLATIPAASNQLEYDECAQYCWFKVPNHVPPNCKERSLWPWFTFYAWMVLFLFILLFSTLLVLIKIVQMRVKSRADLRRLSRMSASTFASLSRSAGGSGSDFSSIPQQSSSFWRFWSKGARNPSQHAEAPATTTSESVAVTPTNPPAAPATGNNPRSHDSATRTLPTAVQIEIPDLCPTEPFSSGMTPRDRANNMVAAMTHRREQESSFLFAILRQALYPIAITVTGCIQIFVDLTLNNETPKQSTLETATTFITNIQGFLFFLVFLFDPAVMQWRRMWKEFVIWKWYVEFYFSLGMLQEGKEFEDRFLANCREHMDEDPSLVRFLRPPTYAWSHSYQRYVVGHTQPFRSAAASGSITEQQDEDGEAATSRLHNKHHGPHKKTKGDTSPAAIRPGPTLRLSDTQSDPTAAHPEASSSTSVNIPSTISYTPGGSVPLATLHANTKIDTSQPSIPPPVAAIMPPPNSLQGFSTSHGGNHPSWHYRGAASNIHPLSEDEREPDIDEFPALSAAALSPFRAPSEPSKRLAKSPKPRYFRQYAQQLFKVVSTGTSHADNDIIPTLDTGDVSKDDEEGDISNGEPGSSYQSSQDMNDKHITLVPGVDDDLDDDEFDTLTDAEKAERRRRRRESRPTMGRRTTIGGSDASHNPYMNDRRVLSIAADPGVRLKRQPSGGRHWWPFMSMSHAPEDETGSESSSRALSSFPLSPVTRSSNASASFARQAQGRVSNCSSRGSRRARSGSSASHWRPCHRMLKFSTRNDRRNTPEIQVVYQKPFLWLPTAYLIHKTVRRMLVPKLARLPPIPYPQDDLAKSRRARQESVDFVIAGLWQPRA